MRRVLSFLALTLMLASCKTTSPQGSTVQSGGGTNPQQLGCEGLQASFVDDGTKLDGAISAFAGGSGVSAAVDAYRGVKKAEPFKGELGKLLQDLVLPAGIASEASCTAFAADAAKYDACTEMVIYRKRLAAYADVWDNNRNAKKCYEGQAFETVRNPEFGYCDNECAFNDEQCYACDVTVSGGSKERFVCKSLRTATDAIGAFCRNSGVKCDQYEPQNVCQAGKGKDFAGTGGVVLGGTSEESFEAALSGYVGASESVKVNAGVSAGQKLQARGTATGKLGFKRRQGVGSLFTPTGLGVNGLTVECFLSVSGVAAINYDYTAGVGADFIFVSGEATVDAGGSFSLTKAYTKTSPTFSGAGMSKDAIFKQCLNNYVMSWVGVEMENWVNEYSGLRLIQKAVRRVMSEIGTDASYTIGSRGVYCLYPNYDGGSGWETSEVRLSMGEPLKLSWSHHLDYWPDSDSEEVEVAEETLRPFLRDLKDGTLAGDRLVEFFNAVVVPASKGDSRARWHADRCWR